jgi:hypothetical protein
MARSNQVVIDLHQGYIGISNMTRGAYLSAPCQIFGVPQAKIAFFRCCIQFLETAPRMRSQPRLSWAMATLATDGIDKTE